MNNSSKYLTIANLLKIVVSAIVGLVMFTWWIATSVVMSEDMDAYVRKTDTKIDLLGLSLKIDDLNWELFKIRLTPREDQDRVYQAILGRLQDDLKKYTAQETALLTPVTQK